MTDTTVTASTSHITVLGAGAWGTALAQMAARTGASVTLWAFEDDVVDAINQHHTNPTYLNGYDLSPLMTATNNLANAVQQADLIIVTVPTQFIERTIKPVAHLITDETPVLVASKGIEISTGRLPSQILSSLLPQTIIGALSGPSFAHEVVQDQATAVTLALPENHADLGYHLCETLAQPHFRPYLSHDLIGVQLGGALKNVIAIACGIAEGRGMGHNAHAALMTRGLAEMTRLGQRLGADGETFQGLSGIGDLTLTCHARSSRNYSLGIALGQGHSLEDIMKSRKSVAEGVHTAEAVVALAHKHGIEMPIAQSVYDITRGYQKIDHVIRALLARPVRIEAEAA